MPDKNYVFPTSTTSKKNLKFQFHWFERFPWLVYSTIDNGGALCKYCVIFGQEFGGKGNNQKLSSLVFKIFNNWKHAIEVFSEHSKKDFHKTNVLRGDNFIAIYLKNQQNIAQKLDSARAAQISLNRKRLLPIIETIILCGRQEIAFRGTNDSGPLSSKDVEPEQNDGHFRALLRMREQIVEKINKSKCFSVLVDETTDISCFEQLSLCVWYLEQSIDAKNDITYVLKEDFLQFIPVYSTTGQNLATVILENLKRLGVNSRYMLGQGYDGAASMSGNFKGVQSVIREKHPAALYVHCSAHSLNLALAHSSNINYIRNCIGTIKSVGNFIKVSARRTELLKNKIKEFIPEKKWTKLTSMCETRWVENHDGMIRFLDIYKPIVDTLDELQLFHDIETSSKALNLYRSITTSEFVISLVTANTLFSLTLPLCKSLQSVTCDLSEAVTFVETVLNEVEDMRININQTFKEIFEKATNMLKLIDGEDQIKMPRLIGRQKNRNNVNVNSAIPFYDDFIQQLKDRFSKHKTVLSSLYLLIPKMCYKAAISASDFNLYSDYIDMDLLQTEIKLWNRKWISHSQDDRPSTAVEALNNCNSDLFPCIYFLLKVLAALPVSTATPERTFSTLKRTKTFLRNAIGQNRLNGLALLSVHRNIKVDPEDVLNKFALQKDRAILLI
ncbi:52 kDa repressor of the inhibitor of the protein kinase-like [Metopolophium dirhodum]|uniref:52 kDa repressor of the inhibitor of the protein kinase-like n=1 Tax=Metopolophium dirhodum TaxID=44670 RepID=UPI00298FC64B|nr:52 kDa repressor of the inhibitor of the protein kinase-like [Metopolophium dirhodum]